MPLFSCRVAARCPSSASQSLFFNPSEDTWHVEACDFVCHRHRSEGTLDQGLGVELAVTLLCLPPEVYDEKQRAEMETTAAARRAGVNPPRGSPTRRGAADGVCCYTSVGLATARQQEQDTDTGDECFLGNSQSLSSSSSRDVVQCVQGEPAK